MTYKLNTLSGLIASPRANAALYEELDGFSLEKLNAEAEYLEKSKLKVIFPFYQYGEYTEYVPESAEYYLPGTSVKGMLCQGSSTPVDVMADDVQIHNDSIVLRNLYKVQYLKDEDEQKARYNVFFENVGVEMIKAHTELTGNIYVKDQELAKALFYDANKSTRAKLKQMLAYFCEHAKKNHTQDILGKLQMAIDKMSPLLEANDIFLLGGYKGLLHSMEIKDPQRKLDGAVFLDIETMLPHGLIKVELT
jgi:hypothetical protein